MKPIILLFAAAILAGCGSSTEPERGSIELFTTATAYAPGAPIEVTVVNRTSSTVLIMQCKNRMALAVQKLVSGTWTNAAGSDCADSSEMPVEPAANLSEFRLIAEPGTYRFIIYGRAEADDFGDLVATSNSFTVQ